MKNIKSTTIFSILALLVLIPVISFAADPTVDEAATYGTTNSKGGGIVPTCTGSTTSSGERACGYNDLVTLFKRVIVYLIFIGTTLASISVAYAGFLYMTSTGNTGKIEKAHQIFSTVIIGLIFLWGGWLLISTILKTLGVESTFSLLNI